MFLLLLSAYELAIKSIQLLHLTYPTYLTITKLFLFFPLIYHQSALHVTFILKILFFTLTYTVHFRLRQTIKLIHLRKVIAIFTFFKLVLELYFSFSSIVSLSYFFHDASLTLRTLLYNILLKAIRGCNFEMEKKEEKS